MKKDNRNYGSKKDYSSSSPGKGKGDFGGKKSYSKDSSFGKSKFSGEKGDKWSDKKSGFGKGEYKPFGKGDDNSERRFFKSDSREDKKRSWDDKKAGFGKDERRPYPRKDDESGRKSYGSSDREGNKRSWDDKKAGFGKDERRPYPKRDDESGRKSYGSSEREGGKRSWDDKKAGFGKDERRPYPKRDDESGRKSYGSSDREGNKRSWDDKKAGFGKDERRPYPKRDEESKRNSYGSGERDGGKRSWDDKKGFGKDKPYGERRDDSKGGSFEDKPSRNSRDSKPDQSNMDSAERNERKGSFEEKRIKRFFKEEEGIEKDKLVKPDFSKFGKAGKAEKSTPDETIEDTGTVPEEGDFQTVYRGRGKDEKPVYARALKSELPAKQDRPKNTKRPFASDAPTERPKYNLEKLENERKPKSASDEIRLNKYISNSGICSRREADNLILAGDVQVNGQVVTEMGYKVLRSDKVTYKGKLINPEKPVYILLNKPKDFITTTDDPMERKTVMHLIANACDERVFPVGRLDRNTTGLLLFTNDGELADKLSHPSNEVKKIYQVTLDKPLTHNDEKAIMEGVKLEDGLAMVTDMQVLSLDRQIVGLEIHLGRNRIVRRIFAHFGYEVEALDRVLYAGLDKKDLPRGRYRFLTEQEVIRLKYFS